MMNEQSLQRILKFRAQEADQAKHALAMARAEAEAREADYHALQEAVRQELEGAAAREDCVILAGVLLPWHARSTTELARVRADWQESLAALGRAQDDCNEKTAEVAMLKQYLERKKAEEKAAAIKAENAELQELVLARYCREKPILDQSARRNIADSSPR